MGCCEATFHFSFYVFFFIYFYCTSYPFSLNLANFLNRVPASALYCKASPTTQPRSVWPYRCRSTEQQCMASTTQRPKNQHWLQRTGAQEGTTLLLFVLQWSPMTHYIFLLQKSRSDEDLAVHVRVYRSAAWCLLPTYPHRGRLLSSSLPPLPHPAWFFLLLLRLPPLPWKVLSWTHPWLKSFFTQL